MTSLLDRMEARLTAGGVIQLREQRESLLDDHEVLSIVQAVLLAGPTLERRPRELRFQLCGRLGHLTSQAIGELLAECRRSTSPWFEPLKASLHLPGGPLKATLLGGRLGVSALAVTNAPGRLVAGSSDGTLTVWDLQAVAKLAEWKGHSDGVLAVAVNPGGSLLISTSGDRTIKLWDFRSLEFLDFLRYPHFRPSSREVRDWAHESWVTGLALDRDGTTLVSGSNDGFIHVWDLSRREFVLEFRNENLANAFSPIVLNADGDCCISAEANMVHVWRIRPDLERLATLECGSPVTTLALSEDGERLLTGTKDGRIGLWRTGDWELQSAIHAHRRSVTSLDVSNKVHLMVSASADRTIRIWDYESLQPVDELVGHTGEVTKAFFFGNGEQIASSSLDRTVRIWATRGGGPRLEHVCSDSIKWLELIGDGVALGASAAGELFSWDIARWKLLSRSVLPFNGLETVAYSLDARGMQVACGGVDGNLELRSVEPPGDPVRLDAHTSRVQALAFADGSPLLLSGSLDGLVVMWDRNTGREVFRLCLKEPVEKMMISGRFQRAFCLCRDGILRIVDLELRRVDGETPLTPPFSVASVILDEASETILGGAPDGSVYCWTNEGSVRSSRALGRATLSAVGRGTKTREFLLGFADGACFCYDTSTHQAALLGNLGVQVRQVVLHSASSILFGLDSEGVLRAWSLNGLQELATATGDAPFTTFRLIESSGDVLAADNLGGISLFRLRSAGVRQALT